MHPQDTLLVAEALVNYAGDPRDLSPRERRAWELAESLVAAEGVTIEAVAAQVDGEWTGPN